jgi:hypothetical protein
MLLRFALSKLALKMIHRVDCEISSSRSAICRQPSSFQ